MNENGEELISILDDYVYSLSDEVIDSYFLDWLKKKKTVDHFVVNLIFGTSNDLSFV